MAQADRDQVRKEIESDLKKDGRFIDLAISPIMTGMTIRNISMIPVPYLKVQPKDQKAFDEYSELALLATEYIIERREFHWLFDLGQRLCCDTGSAFRKEISELSQEIRRMIEEATTKSDLNSRLERLRLERR